MRKSSLNQQWGILNQQHEEHETVHGIIYMIQARGGVGAESIIVRA
jgi:hypothetical protein